MSIDDLLEIKSQIEFAKKIANNITSNEAFVLVTGDSGSGRSVVLEKIVSLCNNCRIVFVPCKKEMSIKALREVVLTQLFGFSKFDYSLNLADTMIKNKVPTRDKILFVIDDIDDVISSFLDELLALFNDSLGQGRFAFVATCHNIYAQSKSEKLSTYKNAVDIEQIPALSAKEALDVCKYIFVKNGLLKVYNKIERKLPKALESSKGNLSLIIQKTEMLMKEPQKPAEVAKTASLDEKKQKKSGATGIFITILCIAIVLACLVPIFMGSNLFSKNNAAQESSSVSPNSQALDGDMIEPTLDDGALQETIPQGIEVESPEITTEHKVVIEGKNLDKIEKRAEPDNSVYPRTGLAGSQVNDKTAANAVVKTNVDTAPVAIKRGDNLLRKDEIAKEKESAIKSLVKEADKKALLAKKNVDDKVKPSLLESVVTENKTVAQNTVKNTKTAPKAKDTKVLNTTKTNKASALVVHPESVPFTGLAIPGAKSEILAFPDNFYTVQVVAGTNRQKVVDVSAALSDRYWIYEKMVNGVKYYVLIVGKYPESGFANAAIVRLPKAVKAAKPFVKSFKTVKQEMI